MRKCEKQVRIIQETVNTAIICDCCKKAFVPRARNEKKGVLDFATDYEIQEMLHWETIGGYSSIFGDCSRIQIDLCQHCVKKLLGEYLQIDNAPFPGQVPEEQTS